MSAMALPLELQQHIFSFLDTRSFHAARHVCKWWRYASSDTVTLSRQLHKLPILPPADARASTPRELQRLFAQAAHTLMLDLSLQRRQDTAGNLSDGVSAPRVCASPSGHRTVTLTDRTISLFDTSSQPARLLTQRPLNDLKETVGNGPWLRVTPNSWHELALSSDGTLLAVAQERTVQIYNLADEPDSFTVNEYIPSAAGHYICGLSFEQNDHVLRVRLSGKGTVLYLGTPPASNEMETTADMEHWKSRSGLRHAFLDSSKLTLACAADDYLARVSGLQLLRPFSTASLTGPEQPGFLFAAQKHGGSSSSHYVLGHIRASHPSSNNGTDTPGRTLPLTAETDSVTVLADLHSFLSAWDYNLNAKNASEGAGGGLGLWENMPSAHEHHPCFALNDEAGLLALGEKDKKSVRPKPLTQIFLYRVPGRDAIAKLLEEKRHRRSEKWSSLATFLDKLEAQKVANSGEDAVMEEEEEETVSTKAQHKIARIPLCLSTVQGELTDLSFDGELVAKTADCTRTWTVKEGL